MFNRFYKQLIGNRSLSSLLDPTMYSVRTKPVLTRIEQYVLDGHTYKQRKPPQFVQAVAAYEQASKLADELVEKEADLLSPQHKTELANVYAEYASAVSKYRAHHLEIAEISVKKALELDEANPLANALKFELNFDPFAASGKLE